MAGSRDDIIAVEAAADEMVQGLNRTDISSVADLVTELSVAMAPGRRTARGKGVLELLRNLAQGSEAFRLMSSKIDALTDDVIRDVGTLSMRRRRSGERATFRYMMLWLRTSAGWTLASMTWNRDPATEAARPGPSATPAAEDDGLGDM